MDFTNYGYLKDMQSIIYDLIIFILY